MISTLFFIFKDGITENHGAGTSTAPSRLPPPGAFPQVSCGLVPWIEFMSGLGLLAWGPFLLQELRNT